MKTRNETDILSQYSIICSICDFIQIIGTFRFPRILMLFMRHYLRVDDCY